MPLFGRHQEEHEPEPVVEEPPKRSSSIFHRNRPESISPSERSTATVSSSASQNNTTRHRGFLHKNQQAQDPVIAAAEQRIINAEQMEREADRALINAREAVREAREHMRQLKLEMEAQAKALKVRQGQANNIYKRAKPLGRHEVQGL
ncbi:7318c0b5-4993-4026-8487-d359f0e8c03b [Sclerotinia trifoliorum]|uniref:7318c0b5-4993-4026-8487-d359f0e8c03b n=1 Tax=Sclerotinia trifoliorum TaxID=28548 RepID=A0A8H2VPH8_9HELO|nr:7318c0b5-4993-4026-8487-d359f0e8c03b [Sclerotinia trifoliorum]